MLLRHGRALVGLSKDVQQNEICCSLAYGRRAAAYVQSLGLKAVAAVL
jgi:hypothetical protein